MGYRNQWTADQFRRDIETRMGTRDFGAAGAMGVIAGFDPDQGVVAVVRLTGLSPLELIASQEICTTADETLVPVVAKMLALELAVGPSDPDPLLIAPVVSLLEGVVATCASDVGRRTLLDIQSARPDAIAKAQAALAEHAAAQLHRHRERVERVNAVRDSRGWAVAAGRADEVYLQVMADLTLDYFLGYRIDPTWAGNTTTLIRSAYRYVGILGNRLASTVYNPEDLRPAVLTYAQAVTPYVRILSHHLSRPAVIV